MDELRFEPTPAGELLDRAFVVYRKHFARYLAIVALVHVPIGIASMGLMVVWAQYTGRSGPADVFGTVFGSMCAGWIVIWLLKAMGDGLATAALVRCISCACFDYETTLGHAYRHILPQAGWIILASLIANVATFVALMLCYLPALPVFIFFSLTIPVLVLEGGHAFTAIGRSFSLVAAGFGRAMFVLGFATLGYMMVLVLLGAIGQGLFFWQQETGNAALGLALQQVVAMLPPVIATPLLTSAAVLFYYDMRVRREGFDLEVYVAERNAAEGSGHA